MSQDIIQITANWSIDLNALRGILIVGKPLSERELFTRHNLMIKDGQPYTGDKNGNVGTNTKHNFMNWLEQCAEFIRVNGKILIQSVNNITSISHVTKKPQYKPYIEALFYEFLNNEYQTSIVSDLDYVSKVEISLINDCFPYVFDIMGDIYNTYIASYYDEKLRKGFYDTYDIANPSYFGYIMRCLRNSIIQNIDNAVADFSAFGMNTKFLYALNGNPLTTQQEDYIDQYYISPIRYNDALRGINYRQDLTGEINRRLKKDFKDKRKITTLSNGLQISGYTPICETWNIEIDRKYKMVNPKLDIDFCKKKLNENAIRKILDISGYDTILKYYHVESIDFIIPEDLRKYLKKFPFSKKFWLSQYLSDLDTIIKDIG